MNARAELRSIKGWLRRDPYPVTVRVATETGEKIVSIDAKDPRRWARAEDTIRALGPLRIEALGKDGKTLRAHVFEVEPDEEEPAKPDGKGPNTELAQLAALLNACADNAAKRHSEGYGKAFELVLGLAKSLVDAQTKLIGQVNALSNKVAKLSADGGGEAPADPSDMVPQMLMDLVMKKTGGSNGASNGAGPKLDMAAILKFAQEQMEAQKANGAAPKEGEE